MPSLSSAGMATSARQVVGLHEPPRKTSGAVAIVVVAPPAPSKIPFGSAGDCIWSAIVRVCCGCCCCGVVVDFAASPFELELCDDDGVDDDDVASGRPSLLWFGGWCGCC